MPAAAVAMLLGAALAHATWNYVAKGVRNDLPFQFSFTACSAVVFAPVALFTWLIARPDLAWQGLIFAGVSALFHLVYYVMLTQGYQRGDLSLVYPLARGTGPVLAIVLAVFIYDERPSALALVGAGLVIAGIAVIALPSDLRTIRNVAASVAFALATGACTAGYTLIDKRGVGYLSPVIYALSIDSIRGVYLGAIALRTDAARRAVARTLRQRTGSVVAVGVLTPLAYVLVLAALNIAPVSYVAPAREMSIVVGALLGARLLGEPDAARRLTGAAVIVSGVFALALG